MRACSNEIKLIRVPFCLPTPRPTALARGSVVGRSAVAMSAAMETADYIELRQTPPPPPHRAREGRMTLTVTFACALLLLLLHATTTPGVARTRGAASLFGTPASADDTVNGLSASADGSLGIGLPAAADDNFGLPASVVIVAENTVEHARQRLRVALSANSGPNCRGQFSPHRFAFLFLPGNYELDLEIGFYMQVAGLGRTPEQVTFTNRAPPATLCERACNPM